MYSTRNTISNYSQREQRERERGREREKEDNNVYHKKDVHTRTHTPTQRTHTPTHTAQYALLLLL